MILENPAFFHVELKYFINNIIFSFQHGLQTHCLIYKKSDSFVYIFVVNFQFFSGNTGQTYKAENWHDLSHEQYISKHRF